MVMHDLRTPLSSIQGYVDMLESGHLGPLTSEQEQALEHICSTCRFISRLANDLLDARAAEMGHISLCAERFEPADIARPVVDICRPLAAQRCTRIVA